MGTIKIQKIGSSTKELKKFINFQWEIYKGNKYWVPPLIFDQLNKLQNGPYLESGIIQPFLAYRDEKIAGRIIAHYDKKHNEFYNQKRGCIGFFECINDKEVSRALFKKAEDWCREQGMDEIHGPYNFLLYDPSGLLLNDYDNIPALELNYNPSYYIDLFKDYGFQKEKDWYAYQISMENKFSPLFYKFHNKIARKIEEKKDGLTIRNINLKKYENERENILEIINSAWKDNWGHYPLSDAQIDGFGQDLKTIANEELIMMAFYNERPAGFILSVPDLSPAIQKANGHLFPFGLFKILWNKRKVKQIKTMLMGVVPEFRKRGLDVYFYVETFERSRRMGYTSADLSLIVEDNIDMINALNHMGAEIYKTYRFYKKPITM